MLISKLILKEYGLRGWTGVLWLM